jgi:hypothetical protein
MACEAMFATIYPSYMYVQDLDSEPTIHVARVSIDPRPRLHTDQSPCWLAVADRGLGPPGPRP